MLIALILAVGVKTGAVVVHDAPCELNWSSRAYITLLAVHPNPVRTHLLHASIIASVELNSCQVSSRCTKVSLVNPFSIKNSLALYDFSA